MAIQDYSAIISRGVTGQLTYNDIYDSGYDGMFFGGQEQMFLITYDRGLYGKG